MFKIGDKVRAIGRNGSYHDAKIGSYHDAKIGSIWTVISVGGKCVETKRNRN